MNTEQIKIMFHNMQTVGEEAREKHLPNDVFDEIKDQIPVGFVRGNSNAKNLEEATALSGYNSASEAHLLFIQCVKGIEKNNNEANLQDLMKIAFTLGQLFVELKTNKNVFSKEMLDFITQKKLFSIHYYVQL
jgi:hypothetical protein